MLFVWLMLGGCTPEAVTGTGLDTGVETWTYDPFEVPTVVDLGIASGLQDPEKLRRGRGCMAGDLDGDGLMEIAIINPSDPSGLFRNVSADGTPSLIAAQGFGDSGFFWGGTMGDVDNDGDLDLFIANGGNEGRGYDQLLLNQWSDQGFLAFEDVSERAGVQGIEVVSGDETVVMKTASAHATFIDVTRDGVLDLWVNGNIAPWPVPGGGPIGRNSLFEGGDGVRFTNITQGVGLGATNLHTRHSTWLDVDNDGDLDLYEMNYRDPNVLWIQEGDRFVDRTTEFSLGNEDLRMPWGSFASGIVDANNDGWEDIMVWGREPFDQDTYGEGGHALFLNTGALGQPGFVNVAEETALNHEWERENGVMGATVADINLDGYPDFFVGNGGPPAGNTNNLIVSVPETLVDIEVPGLGTLQTPLYGSWTPLIDFEAQPPWERHGGHDHPWPTYPYRTHGTCIVDLDRDGVLELVVTNGGPAASEDEVQEPDRLFDFQWKVPRKWLVVQPRGDGWRVPADGTGTRVKVTAIQDGELFVQYQRLGGNQGFSVHNGQELMFGLRNAEQVVQVELTWSDGFVQTLDGPIETDQILTVERVD